MSASSTLQIVHPHHVAPGDVPALIARALRTDTSGGNLLRSLVNSVGGIDELMSLDDHPWPEEPFDQSAIEAADAPLAAAVVALLDSTLPPHLDTEFLTIARRLFLRVLQTDPAPVRRSQRPERVAAGITHAVLWGNGIVGTRAATWRGQRLRANDVSRWFGAPVASGNASRLVAAANLPWRYREGDWPYPYPYDPGLEPRLRSSRLLHSTYRRRLQAERDRAIVCFLEEDERREAALVSFTTANWTMRRGYPALGVKVERGTSAGDEAIALGLSRHGTDEEREVHVLSVEMAHRLHTELCRALTPAVWESDDEWR